jgi:hypothetical protein
LDAGPLVTPIAKELIRMPAKFKRSQLLADLPVQGSIIAWMVFYWGASLLMLFGLLFFWTLLTGPARMSWMTVDHVWFKYGAVFVAAALLLPLIVWDMLKLTNRFAGPVRRLRNYLHQLAEGKPVPPLHFRKGDYWHDLANDFNRVVERIEQLEKALREKETTFGRSVLVEELLAAESSR